MTALRMTSPPMGDEPALVAQVFNLPYRRLSVGRPWKSATIFESRVRPMNPVAADVSRR
jgi:hypothetical protein